MVQEALRDVKYIRLKVFPVLCSLTAMPFLHSFQHLRIYYSASLTCSQYSSSALYAEAFRRFIYKDKPTKTANTRGKVTKELKDMSKRTG